jgi:hypothetical protein
MNRGSERRILVYIDERSIASQSQQEGFRNAYAWEYGPNVFYPEHTHADETAHIILSGEMSLTMNEQTKSYGAGERCDVPAESRTQRMRPQGCRYLIAER